MIVVDDGSQDETPARLAELGDPRLTVIRHETSRGVAVARNAGIAAARGRWVSFLDDDDLWSPHKLRAQLDSADAAGAVFAYSAGGGLDAARNFLFAVSPPDPATVTRRASALERDLVRVLERHGADRRRPGARRLRRAARPARRLGPLDPAGARRARRRDVATILVGYVMHDESMLLTDRRDVFPEMDYLVEKHEAAAREHGVEPDQALFARWVARGHRRAGRRTAGGADVPPRRAASRRPRGDPARRSVVRTGADRRRLAAGSAASSDAPRSGRSAFPSRTGSPRFRA